jgi:uncharacterized RDD family membrane protein YckC
MEETPQPTPADPAPESTTANPAPKAAQPQPTVIAVSPQGDATPVQPLPPAQPVTPLPVGPRPAPVPATPAAPRPYRPIILPDEEPEQFDHGHGHPLILLIRRGLAFLIDTVGVGAVVAIFGYHAMTTGHLNLPQSEQGMLDLFAFSLGAALVLLFLFEAITGTSIGKLIFGLHVRRVSGQRAGIGKIFWRNLFRILDILLIGVILILVLRHRQRAGDKVSDTTVGRSPIGPFSTITGLLIIGALSWAVVEYGGGASTLEALEAQVKTYAPAIYQQAVTYVQAHGTSTPTTARPQGSAAPAAQASTAPATQASSAPSAQTTPVSQTSTAPRPTVAPTAV